MARVTAQDLSRALVANPDLVKMFLAACNMGGRAVKKDLGFGINTMKPNLDAAQAVKLAGHFKKILQGPVPVDRMLGADRYAVGDSAIRQMKGAWEKEFVRGLVARGYDAKKRKFDCDGESFELDVASPSTGPIDLAVDVKQIAGTIDKDKRADEITRKAEKFKKAFPRGKFVAVVYCPVEEDHPRIASRLRSGNSYIDAICFAGDDDESKGAALDAMETCLASRRAKLAR
jgi:hypothetical protein